MHWRSMKYENSFFEALLSVVVPLKSREKLASWWKFIYFIQCQSNYLKILLLLFPAPCHFFLEGCFAEWLFLAAQLSFPGSPLRRLFLGCWYCLFQQVYSALPNPKQLLLCMPACLVNHLSLCFLESEDLLLLASYWKITERKMFFS